MIEVDVDETLSEKHAQHPLDFLLNRPLDDADLHSAIIKRSREQQPSNEEHSNVSQEYASVILKW